MTGYRQSQTTAPSSDLLEYHHALKCLDCEKDRYARVTVSTCSTVALLKRCGR